MFMLYNLLTYIKSLRDKYKISTIYLALNPNLIYKILIKNRKYKLI